jgi:HTH-type transcriptional regulator, transcriptional repressor of NAD biosynthesis genes
MSKALVLMKAMPLTKGHVALIQFANDFTNHTTVLVDMASNEPMREERILSIMQVCRRLSNLSVVEPKFITIEPQFESDANDYWEQWDRALEPYKGYDYVIGSEDYCFKIAEMIGARYIPFDPNRELTHTKAEDVRLDPLGNFDMLADEFKPFLQRTITIFGAESTGKTTLGKALTAEVDGEWVFEWARPYLETVGVDINVQSMTDIWHGQYAVEHNAMNADKPFIIRDTDLYSTIGYWEQPHWEKELGPVPESLIMDAQAHKADLYIITKSNIPFEEDPLRYGGDKRESPDEYWVAVAEKYNLNYVVLDTADESGRLREVVQLSLDLYESNAAPLHFDRRDT